MKGRGSPAQVEGAEKGRGARSEILANVATATEGAAVGDTSERGCGAAAAGGCEFFSSDLFGEPMAAPAKRGRKRHQPSAAMADQVAQLRAEGCSIDVTSRAVGVSRNTLFRHYAAALGSRSQAGLCFADPGEAAQYPRPALGRPRHVPTIATSARVRELVGEGANLTAIAAAIGIAPQTLQRHYRRELQLLGGNQDGRNRA
ncbi:MAG: hypothetical protein NXH88_04625 [Hyphomonas sp.]|nr:hypothetical protein [Hyphomonas sp.]